MPWGPPDLQRLHPFLGCHVLSGFQKGDHSPTSTEAPRCLHLLCQQKTVGIFAKMNVHSLLPPVLLLAANAAQRVCMTRSNVHSPAQPGWDRGTPPSHCDGTLCMHPGLWEEGFGVGRQCPRWPSGSLEQEKAHEDHWGLVEGALALGVQPKSPTPRGGFGLLSSGLPAGVGQLPFQPRVLLGQGFLIPQPIAQGITPAFCGEAGEATLAQSHLADTGPNLTPMPWPESTLTHRSHQKVSAPPAAQVQPGRVKRGGGREAVPCTGRVQGQGPGSAFRVRARPGSQRPTRVAAGGLAQSFTTVCWSTSCSGVGLPMLGSGERASQGSAGE